jgi:hypothetical protein
MFRKMVRLWRKSSNLPLLNIVFREDAARYTQSA